MKYLILPGIKIEALYKDSEGKAFLRDKLAGITQTSKIAVYDDDDLVKNPTDSKGRTSNEVMYFRLPINMGKFTRIAFKKMNVILLTDDVVKELRELLSPRQMGMTEQIYNQVVAEIQAGHKIQAIKMVRGQLQLGLLEAKNFVESLQDKLQIKAQYDIATRPGGP